MGRGEDATMRLKRVLLGDKIQSDKRFTELVAFDVSEALRSYLDFSDDDVELDISVDGDGFYRLSILVKAERLKSIRII